MRGSLRMRRSLLRPLPLLGCITFLILLAISATYWPRCVSPLDDNREGEGGVRGRYEPIDCVVNGEQSVPCRREGAAVYVPFSFVSNYFEVYGKLVKTAGGVEQLDWRHSYASVYRPARAYSPRAAFMSFEHYNVESRDRVKCISGMEGVPLSTQWGPQGYYYPIQIAQYGLSHYSKYLAVKAVVTLEVVTLEDGEDGRTDRWTAGVATPTVPVGDEALRTVFDEERGSRVIEFSTNGVSLHPAGPGAAYSHFAMSVRFHGNASVTVTVELRDHPGVTHVHYTSSMSLIDCSGDSVTYGIGPRRQWGHISRDLANDVLKGWASGRQRGAAHRLKRPHVVRVVAVTLRGGGRVDNVTLSASPAHLDAFYSAANWLVRQQGTDGGWPVPVTRRLAADALVLPPGWHSAMAQGQAMSVLVRAFSRTADNRYLASALRATALLDINSSDGGVLAKLAGHNWYEEYPTTPPSYVLNGFMYALIGLYDVSTVATGTEGVSARKMYRTGVTSLRTLLPLYDTGSGSLYDLRHFTLGVAPNRARWDYHATHINQLLLLASTMDGEGEHDRDDDGEFFSGVAARWIGYMNGRRAAHN